MTHCITLSSKLMSTMKATHAHLMITVTSADFCVRAAHVPSAYPPLNTKIDPKQREKNRGMLILYRDKIRQLACKAGIMVQNVRQLERRLVTLACQGGKAYSIPHNAWQASISRSIHIDRYLKQLIIN